MLISKDRLDKVLKYSQIIFYLAFLFLWFEDNFPAFRKINLSYLIPLVPLIIISVIRFLSKFRSKKIRLRIKLDKVFFAVVVLILIAVAIRIPFLVYNFGLVDSDDAISVLVAKHISEGKLPPVFHYGQMYLGTFSYHIYALVFKSFGISILGVLLLSVLFYLAFVIFQFFLFKEIFSSFNLAFVLSFFYCLPIGHLLAVSFHIGGNYPLIFLIISFSIYSTYLIYAKDKEKFLPLLGFCLGFLFWFHPSTLVFSISSFIILVQKFKLKLRKYLILILYGLIGVFPAILSEIYHKFETIKYTFSGRMSKDISLEKIKITLDNIIFLISSEKNFLNYLYFLFLILGIATIIYLNFKKKRFLHQNFFLIIFFIFISIFLFSRFSHIGIFQMRYLYPLYFVIPVFLVSFFNLLRSQVKYIFMILFFLIMMFFSNIKVTYSNYSLVKRGHFHLKRIIDVMERTDKRYWAGEFWQINLLTALSGEKIVGWSYTHEDYFPYALEYFNQGENNNYVFLSEPSSFAIKYKEMFPLIAGNLVRSLNQKSNIINLLDRWDIEAKKEKIGDYCWLIYDISSPVFPSAIRAPIPQQIPEIELKKIESSKAYLSLIFRNKTISEDSGFRLHFGIPGYSSKVKGFSLENEEIKMRIPFPRRKSFKIKYYLDYVGIRIPSTVKEVSFSPSARHHRKRKKEVVYLSGFGPNVGVSERKMKVCEKEAKFEINKKLQEESRVRLHLYSPFQFSHPYWYGEYFQEVKIYVNGHYLTEKRLEDGENIIEFEMGGSHLKKRANFITLRFRYHLPFKFARLWKTAALLDKIEVD